MVSFYFANPAQAATSYSQNKLSSPGLETVWHLSFTTGIVAQQHMTIQMSQQDSNPYNRPKYLIDP